ncbi:TerC family protein [Limnovirga soli]|jgi:predicted tellurium resistance membrane protein TerC|uniref:TerC family protein n=1 Tax=Limnovirga soli TaxID=2656915 RepID=A0A8J8JV72_9BACT|nr:TerC family protein [Limnovirga soli]NNV56314.1 TerC family protein [Limnovirga soli]
MENLFTADALISLLTLTILEIVLGIDNVIFVSILIGRLNEAKQKLNARRVWMFAGIVVRIGLLMGLGWLVNNGSKELFGFTFNSVHYPFNLRNCIMFAGGIFLLYKTVKEIHEKLEGDEAVTDYKKSAGAFGAIVSQIVIVDMVFSFDSIITAIGLAQHVEVMIIAVSIAMVIMFFFSQNIASFIDKHPTLKMLALSFLLMVGFSLFFEGLEPIHHSHIDKTYIYVAMAFSFGVELLNMRIRKKQKNVVKLHAPRLTEQAQSEDGGDMAH